MIGSFPFVFFYIFSKFSLMSLSCLLKQCVCTLHMSAYVHVCWRRESWIGGSAERGVKWGEKRWWDCVGISPTWEATRESRWKSRALVGGDHVWLASTLLSPSHRGQHALHISQIHRSMNEWMNKRGKMKAVWLEKRPRTWGKFLRENLQEPHNATLGMRFLPSAAGSWRSSCLW